MPANTNAQRKKLFQLLKIQPKPSRRVRVISRRIASNVEDLVLDLNGVDPVPALFFKPKNARAKLPVILFQHSHGGRYAFGKTEVLTSAPYMQKRSYLRDLTDAGFAVLAIDHWNFGERHTRTESSLSKEMLWTGRVLWGQMVFDSIRATDYLLTRDDVDASRIGTIGMSMGATMAWWHAALDERIKCVVDLCCMTDFNELIRTGGLDEHGPYYYVPDLLTHYDTASINALIAPRPHLSMNGRADSLTPLKGLRKIDRALKDVYRKSGHADAWRMVNHNGKHVETAAMRKMGLDWLKRWL